MNSDKSITIMSKPQHQIIYEGLREFHGSIQECVDRTTELREEGYCRDYVYDVLRGQYTTGAATEILALCSKVLTERRQKDADLRRQLSMNLHALAATA